MHRNLHFYALSPFSLLTKVLNKIIQYGAEEIFVAPTCVAISTLVSRIY